MHKHYVPSIDVNDSKVKIIEISRGRNDYVEKGELVVTVETTKATHDIETETSGYFDIDYKVGDEVGYGETLFVVKDSPNESQGSDELDEDRETSDLLLTKKAKQYVADHNIDLDDHISDLEHLSVVKVSDLKTVFQDKSIVETVICYKRVVIVGAGTSGEVVADILLDDSRVHVVGFVDDNPAIGETFMDIPLVSKNLKTFQEGSCKVNFDCIIISFGGKLSNRDEKFREFKRRGFEFINAIDKSVRMGRNVLIGVGNVIGANTFIGTSSRIDHNNWIAANVNIDHHNVIGSSNLFGPGFVSPGKVRIGNMNLFGANSSLSNNVAIGDSNIVLNNRAIFSVLGDNQIVR